MLYVTLIDMYIYVKKRQPQDTTTVVCIIEAKIKRQRHCSVYQENKSPPP